jgi:hypothetical protein
VTDEMAHCWLAFDLEPLVAGSEPESTEQLSIWRVSWQDAVSMVWEGVIFDSMTVLAVTQIEALRLRGELVAEVQIALSQSGRADHTE